MSLFILPSIRATDANGVPLPGAKLFFYTTGTSTLANTYTTSARTVAHSNPVVADAGGLFEDIYLDPTVTYRAVLKSALGVTIDDIDPYNDTLPSAVFVEDFGAIGDGTTNDTAAINAALAAASNSSLSFTPGKTYLCSTNVNFSADNVLVHGNGATLSSALTGNVEAFTISGDNVTIEDLTLLCPGGSTAYTNFTGANAHINDSTFTRSAATDTIQAYVREGADGFEMTGCAFSNANAAIAILASDILITESTFVAAVGGDDAIPIRAITAATENIRITNNRIVGHAAGLSIGSTVGTPGADDPTYSKAVRNVVFLGNTMENCARMAYIKPGAIASDYRNGLVENVVISNNTLEDRSGSYFNGGINIRVARGAWVRNIKGENNLIIARADDGTEVDGRKRVFDIYGTTDGAASIVEDIDVGISFIDPYDGAANDVSHPGYPVFNIASCENDNTNGITARNIHIRIDGNGSAYTGIDISDEFTGAVYIDRARLKNINTTATAAAKGIRTQSANTYLGNDISISMSSGSAYGVLGVGTFKAAYATDHSSLSSAAEARANLGLGTALAAATTFSGGYVVDASAVAVANTGSTTENTVATITIPAGAMGANGLVIVEAIWTVPNNANNKTMRTKFGGTNVNVQTVTTQQSYTQRVRIRNRNSASSQVCPPSGLSTGEGFSTAANVTTAINTASATTVTLTAQCAVGTDTITLEEYTVMVFPKA